MNKKNYLYLIIFSIFVILLYIYNSNAISMIDGETFCLSDNETKHFYRTPLEVKRVYSYDEKGNAIVYIENRDYIIDYKNGTIRRTESSLIPNFRNHKVIYETDKKFKFNSEPRNPELNVFYQIHVDYTYKPKIEEYKHIDDKSSFLSKSTRDLILNGANIRIALVGDSISCGAQTSAQFFYGDSISNTFFGYLKENIESYYGCKVITQLVSKVGVSRLYLLDNIDNIINEKPNIVIVEFGMNDHIVDNGLVSFKEDITKCIKILQNNNIDVVLMGFFQQNKDWEEENEMNTILYNSILKDIANDYGCYFADVYDVFNKVSIIKKLEEDLLVDYMHHPSDWGHQLYLTSLMPLFNISGNMTPVKLSKYVYVK